MSDKTPVNPYEVLAGVERDPSVSHGTGLDVTGPDRQRLVSLYGDSYRAAVLFREECNRLRAERDRLRAVVDAVRAFIAAQITEGHPPEEDEAAWMAMIAALEQLDGSPEATDG
jgi:hypothetical protein